MRTSVLTLAIISSISINACQDPSTNPPESSMPFSTTKNLNNVEKDSAPLQKTVTITSSDSGVDILKLSSPWGSTPGKNLKTPRVSFERIGDDHGIECQLDQFWLETSNRGHISPRPNICENWSFEANTSFPVFAPESKVELPSEMTWQYYHVSAELPHQQTSEDVLTFGVPETDQSLLTATCTTSSGWVTLKLNTPSEGSQENNTPANISITPTFSKEAENVKFEFYRLQSGWEIMEVDGYKEKYPTLFISTKHPVWHDISKAKSITLAIDDEVSFKIPMSAHYLSVRNFIKSCRGS